MFNMLTVSFNNFLNWAISLEFTPAPGAEAKKIRLTVNTAAELCVLGSCLLSWDPALLPPSTNHTLPLQDLVSLGDVFSFFFLNLFILFIYFWLCWVFVAVHGLSLVVESGVHSSLWCAGFSLQWFLLLRSTGSRCAGFSSCGRRAQ